MPAPAPQVAFSTAYRTAPYLTVAEFRTDPNGVDTSSLIPGGTQAAQDQVLADKIVQASGWVDVICDQILAATVDIEARRLRVRRDGTLIVHPDNWPVLEVRDLQYGADPSGLTALSSLSGIWIEERQFTVTTVAGMTTIGPLQLGGLMPGQLMLVRYTYVNGWPNTFLAASTIVGATSIIVDDATGIYAADVTSGRQATKLVVDTGALEETVTVTAAPTGNTVPISAMTNAHASKVRVSALPPPVKQATILLTAALIKTRGVEALIMPQVGLTPQAQTEAAALPSGETEDIAIAKELLRSFARVR